MSDAPTVTTADLFAEVSKLFGVDKKKEAEGIVMKLGKMHMRIARLGENNKKARSVFEREMAPYAALTANGIDIPEDVQREVSYRVFAEGAVLGWGMESDTGYVELPYTPDEGVKLFVANPEFFAAAVAEAKKASNFRNKVAETEEKN
jgi:hypothetical protein